MTALVNPGLAAELSRSDEFNADAGVARLYGGMHFRFATVAGETLGKRVAQWVTARHFARQD